MNQIFIILQSGGSNYMGKVKEKRGKVYFLHQ